MLSPPITRQLKKDERGGARKPRKRDKQKSIPSAKQTSKAWGPHFSASVFTTETAGNTEGSRLFLGDTQVTAEQALTGCCTLQKGLSSLSIIPGPCLTSFIALDLVLAHFAGKVTQEHV